MLPSEASRCHPRSTQSCKRQLGRCLVRHVIRIHGRRVMYYKVGVYVSVLGPNHDGKMTSIATMPVEIVFEIIHLILDEDLMLPAVGRDAASVAPPDSQIRWKQSLKKRIVQKMTWNSTKNSSGAPQQEQETEKLPFRRPHCSLKALRRTNRFFNEICQPFLFRELNLLSDLKMRKLKRMKDIFSTPKWTLVQSISVYMDPNPANLEPDDFATLEPFVDQVTSVVYILERCRNINTLALYYRDANVQMMGIRDALFSLLGEGRLSTLGLYSCRLLHDEAGRDDSTGEVTGLVELLESVALSEVARQSLRVLDVVADWVPTRIFDLIRSNFTGLVSLTLRRVVREPWFPSRIWDVDQQPKWYPYPNLTRLELNDFEPGYPVHIPFLVQNFIGLKELKISACGKAVGGTTNWRPSGWSRREDSLCNTHQTLTRLHIEHMEDWEIYELGVIPTTTLLVTTIKQSRLLELFSRDDETFPGLQVLRLAPQDVPASGVETTANDTASMEAVFNSRSVQLRFDAPITQFPCTCTWHLGH